MKLFSIALVLLSFGASADVCPSKPQSIKVIDLKSGWWQGDGGDTDQYVIRHITGKCPNVHFFYQHTLYGGSGFNLPHDGTAEPAEFDQIWLLSGGEADGSDLRVNDPTFVNYLKLMTEGKGNLFVGTGFGNVYHAKALTEALGLGVVALTGRDVHEYPSAMGRLEVLREIPEANLKADHLLFAGISVLPDQMKLDQFLAVSDWLDASKVETLATDADGHSVIGQLEVNGRRMILDMNMPRTFLIRQANPAIEQYLLNLVKVLEH